MKIIVPLGVCLVLSAVYAPTAKAGLIWNNGTPLSLSTNCDSSPDVCNGPDGNPGWTVYDDFSINDPTTITSFSFDSFFKVGSESDYISTNWSIWDIDPFNPFGIPALATGNDTATLSTDSSGAITVTKFTFSGLSVDLVNGGTYWLGYNNVLQNNGAKTVVVLSNNSDDPNTYEQSSNDGNPLDQFQETGNTVFTIGEASPEPSTWALLGLGLAYLAKRRGGR
jgi:hypothetical protein